MKNFHYTVELLIETVYGFCGQEFFHCVQKTQNGKRKDEMSFHKETKPKVTRKLDLHFSRRSTGLKWKQIALYK